MICSSRRRLSPRGGALRSRQCLSTPFVANWLPPFQLSHHCLFEVGPFGILSLKKRDEPMMTDQVQHLIDHQYGEEDARTLEIASKG